jgi:hypothetical protein
MALKKEVIEYIDTICEWPPVEFNIWPYGTFEERLKEDDHIADIAVNIAKGVLENADVEHALKTVISVMLKENQRLNKLCQLMREELEQIQGFKKNIESKNLDGRLIALEEKTTRKYKPKYK